MYRSHLPASCTYLQNLHRSPVEIYATIYCRLHMVLRFVVLENFMTEAPALLLALVKPAVRVGCYVSAIFSVWRRYAWTQLNRRIDVFCLILFLSRFSRGVIRTHSPQNSRSRSIQCVSRINRRVVIVGFPLFMPESCSCSHTRVTCPFEFAPRF